MPKSLSYQFLISTPDAALLSEIIDRRRADAGGFNISASEIFRATLRTFQGRRRTQKLSILLADCRDEAFEPANQLTGLCYNVSRAFWLREEEKTGLDAIQAEFGLRSRAEAFRFLIRATSLIETAEAAKA